MPNETENDPSIRRRRDVLARDGLNALKEGIETPHIWACQIEEAQRQAILLAVANLAVERPGWDEFLRIIAHTLNGVELFQSFKQMRQSVPLPKSAASIECPRCHSVSYNPNDIAQRYCGQCHAFHADMSEPQGLPLTEGELVEYCELYGDSIKVREKVEGSFADVPFSSLTPERQKFWRGFWWDRAQLPTRRVEPATRP